MTITRDLLAARNRLFAPTMELEYKGDPLPLTGASISMQVRLYPGADGEPLAEHAAIPFEDVAHETEAGVRVLRVNPEIAQATLAAFPTGLNQPEVGEADAYAYEIKLTYADGAADALWIGNFILEPGVNEA